MNSFEILDQARIDSTVVQAKASPRRRINYNFHQMTDTVQRMLNAIEPDSYVRPHRHLNPPKVEHFLVLQGKLAVLIFSDTGEITDTIFLDGKINRSIDIKPGTWHSIVALESGTVIFETKDGPYVAATDKDFGSWAPDEKSPEKTAYLAKIKQYLTMRCSSD